MRFPMSTDGPTARAERTAKRPGAASALVLLLALAGASFADAAGDAPANLEEAPPGSIAFTGRNLFGAAEGTFHRWRVVEADLDPKDLARARVVVEVDLASVDTGIARRDTHLRTADFFDVERFPTARVAVDGLSPAAPAAPAADAAADSAPAFTATFRIDLHGVTREVDGRIVLASAAPPTFEGELVLDRMDFAIGPAPSRWNPMSIDAEIPVRFRYAPLVHP